MYCWTRCCLTQNMHTLDIEPNELKAKYLACRTRVRQTENILRSNIAKLQDNQPSTGNDEIKQLVYQLELSIIDINAVKPSVLANYLLELTRVMSNVAIESTDFDKFFNIAAKFYESNKQPLTDLYIARSQYLGKVRDVESKERKEILELAVQSANTPEETVKALLALSSYYTDISEYNHSIEICYQCQDLVDNDPNLHKYKCKISTYLGVNYFTSFNDHSLAEKHLLAAFEMIEDYPNDLVINRVASTAYHYLGRLEETRGNLHKALSYYVTGQKHKEKCPIEFGSTAFYHLRMGELLTTARNFPQAYDHLLRSQELFRKVENRSSGWIQVNLAIAAYDSAQGKEAEALETIEKVIRDSENYVRGELLGLGYLLTFHVKHLNFLKIIPTLFRILRVSLSGKGELRRNNLLKLVTKLPLLVLLLLRRIRSKSALPYSQSETLNCICPIHIVDDDDKVE